MQADVWSMGATLYALKTGQLLVASAGDINLLLRAHIRGDPWTLPEQHLRDCSDDFKAALRAMLTVDRAARPTAHQVLQLPAFVAARVDAKYMAPLRLRPPAGDPASPIHVLQSLGDLPRLLGKARDKARAEAGQGENK
jgi:serine/threonine protein kinase